MEKEQDFKTLEQEKDYYPDVHKADGLGFDITILWRILVLNWYWFILCGAIGYGLAYTYLRYKEPVYSSSAKILIKENERRRNALSVSNLGTVSESSGFSTEKEILKSSGLAAEVVRKLHLYTTYSIKGRFVTAVLYKDQPISVEIKSDKLEKLNRPMNIEITRNGNSYRASLNYYVPITEFEFEPTPYNKEVIITKFPTTVSTKVGNVTFLKGKGELGEKTVEMVSILSPQMSGYAWASKLSVSSTLSENSGPGVTADISISDVNVQRSIDYLRELVNCYNLQANEDKNEQAMRTEEFIAERLGKIMSELNQTDGKIQNYHERNKIVDVSSSAGSAFSASLADENSLAEMQVQEDLIKSLVNFARRPNNEYNVIPSNVGLADATSASLISQYNELALERKRLLRSASAASPVVKELTSQLDDVWKTLNDALDENLKAMTIKRDALNKKLQKSEKKVAKSPEQERILTQMGRQEKIQSELYISLLQKREENRIQLASTATKAKIIEPARFVAQIAPDRKFIICTGVLLGLIFPFIVLSILEFFRYKLEGHNDVVKLTTLPVVSDIAVATESTKERGDVVVKKNTNNQMAEIFRGLRTNVQFMLPEGKKRIMLTSTLFGEGKTFVTANLAVSFALLEKKVIMLGLDIRRPRLANLFQLESVKDTQTGISTLLTLDNPSWEEISNEIVPSEVNENLDLLMAGPIPPNPSELLERPTLGIILDRLCEKYDYVIMDTAPIGIVTDTVHIAKYADATLFVTRADYTPKSCIDGLNDLVSSKKLHNVGIVINGIDMSKRKNAYSYGYGRYGKYGRYGYSYGKYGRYGAYGRYGGGYYGTYGTYGNYRNSRYGNKKDNSIKR